MKIFIDRKAYIIYESNSAHTDMNVVVRIERGIKLIVDH